MESRCARCGLEQWQWTANHGRGYQRDKQRYCCEPCAKGLDCACLASPVPSEPVEQQERRLERALETREELLDPEMGGSVEDDELLPADKQLTVQDEPLALEEDLADIELRQGRQRQTKPKDGHIADIPDSGG